MESLRRFFSSNLLFLLTLSGSLAGHASLGWFGQGQMVGPMLDREESGRTSIAVQWMAQPEPMPREPLESTEPLMRDHHASVQTPDTSPAKLELAREHYLDPLPVEPRVDGTEPCVASNPSPSPLPPIERFEPPAARPAEQPRDDRLVPRHKTAPTVQSEQAPLDVPETLVSLDSSGAEVPPTFVTRPLPEYPEELLLQKIEGVVRLVVTVQRDGRVASAKVYSSSGYTEMDESALRTVRQWVFSPARRGGVPVEQTVIVPVRFRIRSGD